MNNTIVLTAPNGGFYERILSDFSLGFKQAGINAYWCTYDNAHKKIFYDKVNQINPNLILEIDSILEDKNLINKNIKHAAWIQDYRFNGKSLINGFGESDFIYFIINPIVWDVDLYKLKNWSILYPGAPIADFCEGLSIEKKIDLSFIGFIPRPVNNKHLLVCPVSNVSVPLEVFLSGFDLKALMQSTYSRKQIYKFIDKSCKKYSLQSLKEADLHLIDEVLPRIYERKFVVENMLNISNSVEIYGPDEWRYWDKFNEYHKGYIQGYNELKTVYQKTLVNVHNGGLAMHYRVLECMGAGGFIIINETQLDHLDYGILQYLNPGDHFVHYNHSTLNKTIINYLKNDKDRDEIRLNGYLEVKASHTWKHRAIKVIKDLNLCTDSDENICFNRRLMINGE
jgi:hypothetical protein